MAPTGDATKKNGASPGSSSSPGRSLLLLPRAPTMRATC
uniref:Uncharacterized protein n=1 Tax=Arundo donax TaxID=35708 RepID=A0A0A8Z7U9_ARUDO